MRYRLTKTLYGKLPGEVVCGIKAALEEVYEPCRPRSCTIELKAAPYTHVCGEGEILTIVYAERHVTAEIVSENSLGASGVHDAIGREIVCPVGTTVISIGYMSGYYMHVLHVGDRPLLQLEGAA